MAALAALVAALTLPGFTPLATGPDGGTVLQGTFPGGQRPGLVYLPPGYSAARRYPVVYLLHGMPGSPSEYLQGAGFLAAADGGIASGRLRPFVAVAPAAGPSPKYNGEWAGPWERELVQRVVPWVDAHLSTTERRMIGGLSAGGFGAVDIALRNPAVFSAVASWSGYFHPLRDGPFRHAASAVLAANDPRRLVVGRAAELRARHVRFFLSSGPYHSHWFRPAETRAFARTLVSLGLPVRTLYLAQARGEYTSQVAAALAWFAG